MSLANDLAREYDFVVVGGGTAGAIVASRLAEHPSTSVCLLEAGPSDEGEERILTLHRYEELTRSELDFDYELAPPQRANRLIRQSRARVLGGCSSHNGAACFQTPDPDLLEWEDLGAVGWGPDGCRPFFDLVFDRVHMEVAPMQNPVARAFVDAAREAGFSLRTLGRENFVDGVGWFLFHKRGERRESSSTAYLHPTGEAPANLDLRTNTAAHRIILGSDRVATGVETMHGLFRARREVVLSCGAIDTPKLLLVSGIGPADELRELGITVSHNLPGVGKHLIDHPESVVNWEATRPVPDGDVHGWECALFARTDPALARHDLEAVFATVPYDEFSPPLGLPRARRGEGFAFAPHVSRARSEGFVSLRSANPADPPVIDPRYFTDPDGYDERILVEGLTLGRRIAEMPALKGWVARELSPGPDLQTDAELAEYARMTTNTSHHSAGTCRMGAPADPLAVVDPELRVRGLSGLSIADASIFPCNIGVNPVVTVMMIGEKAARHVQERARRAK